MKTLIAAALQEELQPVIDHYGMKETAPGFFSAGDLSLLITVVGLLRVAVELSDIDTADYDFAFNIGSCGCLNGKYGIFESVEPKGFMQGDFAGFEMDNPDPANKYDPCYLGKNNLSPNLCSVNHFVTEPIPGADLVDMEGYAFAAYMEKHSKPYKVIKIVSDSGDHDEFHNTVSYCIEKNLNLITSEIDRVLAE